jgi:hypothetical protein
VTVILAGPHSLPGVAAYESDRHGDDRAGDPATCRCAIDDQPILLAPNGWGCAAVKVFEGDHYYHSA